MSSLTKCNYCSLKAIKSVAKQKGRVVRKVYEGANFGMGGLNIISYLKGTKLPKLGTDERHQFNKDYHVAWFMEITNCCCC